MLRLLGFFVLVLVTLGLARSLLGGVPVIGPLLHVPLLGFWIVAALLSMGVSKLATTSLDRGKQRALERRLGAVETPHNQGKLGSLLLQQGRYKAALPSLERAAEGEPDVAEWAYRLGLARQRSGSLEPALEAYGQALSLDEGVGFGEPLLRGAETLLRLGRAEDALAWLERFERNHGPSPESAYRRGLASGKLGLKEEAEQALGQVAQLAEQRVGSQRRSDGTWVLRARLARWFG